MFCSACQHGVHVSFPDIPFFYIGYYCVFELKINLRTCSCYISPIFYASNYYCVFHLKLNLSTSSCIASRYSMFLYAKTYFI